MAWGSELESLRGAHVHGTGDEALGEVVDVYTDQGSGRVEWALVRPSGAPDKRDDRFVPLAEATVEGDVLSIPVDPELLRTAPDVGGGGHLDGDAETQLYLHYGLDPLTHGGLPTAGTTTGVPVPTGQDPTGQDQGTGPKPADL